MQQESNSKRETLALPNKSHDDVKSPIDIQWIMENVTAQTITLTEESSEKIELSNFLKNRIIGQDQACEQVADIIDVAINNSLSSEGTFANIFVSWPTGVWKTLTSKELASFFLGDENAVVRIPCEEFQDPHSISKLMWAADWLVGFWKKWYFHEIWEAYESAKQKWNIHASIKARTGSVSYTHLTLPTKA